MTEIGLAAITFAVLFVLYAYAGYPLALRALTAVLPSKGYPRAEPNEWPMVSITVPMYNEEDQAAELLESLLALDYPKDRLQILIVSDGSTDGTDDIVSRYVGKGIELRALPGRSGKTAAENAATPLLRGQIVVNTDASIRIQPDALKRLIAPFSDPMIGLTSGRDVSVGAEEEDDANVGESGYVGYEMWIRDLETSLSGIVGASGCLYATRLELHRIAVPGFLSRDFTAALKCEEHGYRAVSIPDAICLVPRTGSLHREYRRKVRTITRGMETLLYKRPLMNPLRHGLFAWQLVSHKLCRWLAPWAVVVGAIGLALLAPHHTGALALLASGGGAVAVGTVAWALADRHQLPGPLRMLAFAVMGNVAAMHAALNAVRGKQDAIWEPTRRRTQVGS